MAKLNEMNRTPLIALLLASCLAMALLLNISAGRAAAGAASLPGSAHPAGSFAITSLSTRAAWVTQGTAKGAKYGWVVASAGDVNGDGYDDVLVGAPLQSQLDDKDCLLYTSPSPRDRQRSRMPSSA